MERNMRVKLDLVLVFFTLIFALTSTNSEEATSTTGCPEGWRPFRTKCYRIYGNYADGVTNKAFENAILYCSSKHGTLVSIHSLQEQNFLTAYLGESNVKNQAWIGLRKSVSSSGYWIDNSADTEFRNFAPGEPNGGSSESCFNMDTKPNIRGKWNDVPCSLQKAFICQMSRVNGGVGFAVKSDPECPKEFSHYKNFCFGLVKDEANFWSAEEKCETEFGGHLASIRDIYDEAFLATLSADLNSKIWIGFSDHNNDLIKGRFAWTDGSPVYYTNWLQGQPVESTVDRCAASTPNGVGWTIDDCARKHSFVCAKAIGENENDQEIHVGVCPDGFLDVNNRYCYYIQHLNVANFAKATTECLNKAKNGKLAMFENEHDLQLVGAHLRKFTSQEFIVGIRQSMSSIYDFKFVNGNAATYLPWALQEPNNLFYERCVELDPRTLKYNNIACSNTKNYICQSNKDIKHTILSGAATRGHRGTTSLSQPTLTSPPATTPTPTSPTATTPTSTPTPTTPTPTTSIPTTPTPTTSIPNTRTSNTPSSNTPTSNTPTSNTPTSNTPTPNTPTAPTAREYFTETTDNVTESVESATKKITSDFQGSMPDGNGPEVPTTYFTFQGSSTQNGSSKTDPAHRVSDTDEEAKAGVSRTGVTWIAVGVVLAASVLIAITYTVYRRRRFYEKTNESGIVKFQNEPE